MRIKLIAAGAAIALAATLGSAYAADQYTTLEGIMAQAMTPYEMGVVKGLAAGDLAVTPMGVGGGVGVPPTAQPTANGKDDTLGGGVVVFGTG